MIDEAKRLEDARAVVSLTQPLFTAAVYGLKPVEDATVPTMGTDGEYLYWNPAFTKTISDDELCGVVLHEVLHCTFQHLWRRKSRDHVAWNCAADFVINLVALESFPLPKGVLLDKKFKGMSSEQVYDTFPSKESDGSDGSGRGDSMKNGQEKKNKNGQGGGGQSEKEKKERQSKGQQGQDWGDHSRWEKREDKGGSIIDKLTGRNKLPPQTMSEEQKKRKWEKIYEDTIVHHYGKLPETLKRLVEKSFYSPKLDWMSLVSPLLSEDVSDYSFSRPDRRFLDGEFILPDMSSVDKLKDVVFAYDTSGSIEKDDLNSYYMETLALFQNFISLQGWIAVCDAYLHYFGDVDSQRDFGDFHFTGGGGTDFRPVFNEVSKRGIRPKALFYFSDTYGEFPDKDPGYPVFWLVRKQAAGGWGGMGNWKVPFGQVIEYERQKTT